MTILERNFRGDRAERGVVTAAGPVSIYGIGRFILRTIPKLTGGIVASGPTGSFGPFLPRPVVCSLLQRFDDVADPFWVGLILSTIRDRHGPPDHLRIAVGKTPKC